MTATSLATAGSSKPDRGSVGDAVPLVIGVTGHRDLVDEELSLIGQRVREFFETFLRDYPDLPILVMTPLAEGADRLVAEVASELGLPVVVLLPMPVELYRGDFTGSSLEQFDQMMGLGEIVQLPLVAGSTVADITDGGRARDLQYAQLGAYLAAHSHILLAVWDGKPSDAPGGTAQVVRFHQQDVIGLIAEGQHRSPIDFAEDESDLVFHVSCSRRTGGDPEYPLRPGQAHWLSRDDVAPRTAEMPERYCVVFERMSEFNVDMVRRERGLNEVSLITPERSSEVPAGALDIERLYRKADALAGRFKRLGRAAQLLSYSLTVCAMLSFIMWADLPDQKLMIYPYLAFIALVVMIFSVEHRAGWQRKALDYRVLAEGLRVQFWWSVAGVTMGNPSRFAHDRFMRQQDLELGWIRNVMRYAGRRADADIGTEPAVNVDMAVNEWVADQTSYYAAKSEERYLSSRVTSGLVLVTFIGGLAVAVVLAIFQFQIHPPWDNLMVALMGLLPFIAAVRQSYANRTAERELITQYGYMHRIFSNASRLLQSSTSVDDKREILRALGEAALGEHGQWMLRQRERPDAGQVLQGG